MNETTPDVVEELIERARQGDRVARDALLERYRGSLNRMVASRLDRRLASRVDASDVVQETLMVAARQMDDYLRDRPISFLGWLRQLAADRVVDSHRHHLGSQRRSVHRESQAPEYDDQSMGVLVRRLIGNDTSPSNHLARQERIERVTVALAALKPNDRDVLAMHFLEHLSATEIAEALGIQEKAVRSRIFKALDRFRRQMEAHS